MTLQYINPDVMKAVLTKAWQKAMNNDSDPANGQWYTNGANGDGVGLYGGVSDSIDNVASVGAPSYASDPGNLKQTIGALSIVDNRSGLMTVPAAVTLSHSYSTTQAFTHTTTPSINVGVSQWYVLQITLPGASVGGSTPIAFEKTWVTSNSTLDHTTNAATFQQTIQVLPPKGKVYQAVLTYIQNKAVVPYWLNLHCSGETETWYEGRLNGHYNWMNSAPSLVGTLTAADYVALGLDPTAWGVDQLGIWTKGVTGELQVDLIGAFCVSVIDITNQQPNFALGDQIDRSALSSMLAPHQALG